MEASATLIIHVDTPAGVKRDGFVLISYKNEEAASAERIRDALKRAGFAVWWDRRIQCGQVWNQVLDAAVKQAMCIVVLWSPMATNSRWVVHEASVAMARNNYAPVRIDMCAIPSPYDQVQATDIIGWNGQADHPGFDRLLERCTQLMPLRRSRLRRAIDATWARRWLVIAVTFSLIATAILTWQTFAGRSQLEQLRHVVRQQERVVHQLTDFQTQVSQTFLPRLNQLDDVAERQAATVEQLNRFGSQIERKVLPTLEELDSLASKQADAAAQLSRSQDQLDRSIVRGYYPIEPITIEFSLTYSFNSSQLKPYVERLYRDPDFRSYLDKRDILVNLRFPDLAKLLPGQTSAEKRAAELLLSDMTSLEFVDLKQQLDPDSHSFVRQSAADRGMVRFSSYPRPLAEMAMALPRKGEIEQEIDLAFEPENKVFVKTVRCKNPLRTGDDVLALGIVDLIGRRLRYTSADATMTTVSLVFAFDYPQGERAKRYIAFPPGTREVTITPQHVGLSRYTPAEGLRVARKRFDTVLPSEKKALLDAELTRRIELFARTLDRAKHDTSWSLATWAKIEWAADALDGNAPFDDAENDELTFNDRSFKWLLASLARIVGGAEKRIVDKAIEGADRLFDLLARLGAERSVTDVPRSVVIETDHVIEEYGLAPWRRGRERHNGTSSH